MKSHLLQFLFCLITVSGFAQTAEISGKVTDFGTGQPIPMVTVHVDGIEQSEYTNDDGSYRISGLSSGSVTIIFFQHGFRVEKRTIQLSGGKKVIDIQLEKLTKEYEEVKITSAGEERQTMRRMRTVEGAGIYASRKTEVVELAKVQGLNLASNRARQVFAKVSGLNIWESDCAGIQIGVGSRGLSPNRTENFNMRQNGYDISADALGYPESYYSPPMQAISRVEVIRGAASLQFGPQFGGLINFIMKDGVADKKVSIEANYTLSARNSHTGYLSVGGTIGSLRYFAFGQSKKGRCWRCNSDYENYTAYATVSKLWKNSKLKLEYTRMRYLSQQSGGLTDREFAEDASQSNRTRNWFKVDWNVLSLNYSLKKGNTKIDIRNFGVIAERNALGFLGPPTESDPITDPTAEDYQLDRNLINGKFQNMGHETRLLQTYMLRKLPSTFLVGVRVYRGFTRNRQGAANALSGPDFDYVNESESDWSKSEHPSWNVAIFAENVFNLSEKWSVTPGFRLEYIRTETRGTSRTLFRNQAGDIILDSLRSGSSISERYFPLFGFGASFKPNQKWELYFNISQNYKPINFTDLWIDNPSFRIDPGLKDETGFNADLGFRGRWKKHFQVDATLFALWYQDRIGSVQEVDTETFAVYRLRTNVSDARTFGLETFVEADVLRLIRPTSKLGLTLFSNFTLLNAMYVSSAESAFSNKEVEFTPNVLLRTGLGLNIYGISLNYQFNFTGSQFTDATNSESTPNAVNGIIPAYYVMDLTIGYRYKMLDINAGIENLTDNRYFTRRASGYPGPGILPSESRSYFISVGLRF